jgi:hypothetical protein
VSGARERARELLEHAKAQPPSHARVDALLEAARAADAAEDERLGYEARECVIDAAIEPGRIHDLLVAFAWCLAQCDRKPDEFPEAALHWKYKWVLAWAPSFPEISREELLGLHDDAAARFERRGAGAQPLAKLSAQTASMLGDTGVMEERYALWKQTPRDELSDCALCDDDAEVELGLLLGRDEESVAAARDMFRRGASCITVPHATYARVLAPLLRLGRRDEAVSCQRIGFARLRAVHQMNPVYTGRHLAFTAAIGDLGRGLGILRTTLPAAANHRVGHPRMIFLAGASMLLERVAAERAQGRLAVPQGFGGDGKAHQQDVEAVARSFALQADEIARRFDERNGNTAISESLRAVRALRS